MNDPFLPEEVRAFVAVELPDEWREALAQTSRVLSRAGLSSLRWVRPEGIHLTLKFLGDVGRHLLPDIHAALVAAARGGRPFELRLHGTGSFGGRGRVRVIWAGIEGDVRALTELQRRVDANLSELGFAREVRPFSPHLTLARVPENAPADSGTRVATALREASLPEVSTFTVDAMTLMRSQLGAGGARYSSLARVPLEAGNTGT